MRWLEFHGTESVLLCGVMVTAEVVTILAVPYLTKQFDQVFSQCDLMQEGPA